MPGTFYRRSCALFLGIGFALIGLICLELFSLVGNKLRHEELSEYRYRGNYHGKYFTEDALLGYRAPSDTVLLATRKLDGEVVYEARYSFDSDHRRITPIRVTKTRDLFAAFFGGSFVFGEGLDDHETIPFYFCDNDTRFNPYNYGFHGYGPETMLAILEEENISDDMVEDRGILIYVFLPELHVRRAIGSMIDYNGYCKDMPYYALDETGIPRRNGSFATGRPGISSWYRRLDRLQSVRFFKIDFPPKLFPKHYRLSSSIIGRSRDLFKEMFPDSEFLVMVYPSANGKAPIVPYLEELNLKVLDYSDLFDPEDPDYSIPRDGHPSALANRTIAIRLAEDLSG